MAFVSFGARYRLDHSAIDEQHAGLFDAVNRLHDAMMAGKARQELGSILTFLREYTVSHFEFEEGLMRGSGYPEFQAHKRLHDELARQVVELEAKHKSGSMVLSLSVMNFLRDWLAQHISVEDRKVAQHLRGQGIA